MFAFIRCERVLKTIKTNIEVNTNSIRGSDSQLYVALIKNRNDNFGTLWGTGLYNIYRMSVAYTSDIFRRSAVLHSEGRFIDQLTRHLKAGTGRGLNKKSAFHFKMKTFLPDYWIGKFEATMAHFHCHTQIQIRIPNPMAT